jgi:nucleolar protein 6
MYRAGGGGKTKARQAKIGEKNQKLNEQRIRRMQEEEKAKMVKREVAAGAIGEEAIHPSRRGRVPDLS